MASTFDASKRPAGAWGGARAIVGALCLGGWLLAVASPVAAQEEAPQPCGQRASSANYGDIAVGSVVVPQRHRFVGGDPNWDDTMGRFLGRVARVMRLSGVDDRGCPGVRLDVDGAAHFWRVRDLNIGSARPRRALARRAAASAPQACGQADGTADYGPLRVGAQVVLGRHRPVSGDENWSAPMSAFVGRTAMIVEQAGVDDRGCPGVHVDADGRQWFWRVRDLTPSDTSGEAVSYRPGLGSDHGRPASMDAPEAAVEERADARVPQACGQTDETADYGPVDVGTEVVLGRHRAVDGEANWTGEMEPFVGRAGRVLERVGVDEQGCPLIRVDVDDGNWYWRLRDAQLPP